MTRHHHDHQHITTLANLNPDNSLTMSTSGHDADVDVRSTDVPSPIQHEILDAHRPVGVCCVVGLIAWIRQECMWLVMKNLIEACALMNVTVLT